jgi:hypothetical protein
MNDPAAWLPPLLRLEDFGGRWDRYVEAVWEVFRRDFIDSAPTLEGKRVSFRWGQRLEGKAATFWHIVTEGAIEDARLPDLRRCERIGWPRALIDAADTDNGRVWETYRGSERRVLLSPPDFSYLVVLADRGDYLLLWTAYPVEQDRRRQGFRREYEDYVRRSKNG